MEEQVPVPGPTGRAANLALGRDRRPAVGPVPRHRLRLWRHHHAGAARARRRDSFLPSTRLATTCRPEPFPTPQALFLAIHELAHNLFFKTPVYNRVFSFVANWPIGIPYTIPFRGYHLEHHKFQGVDGIDTDIPSRLEGMLVRGPVTKTIWACCQILTYVHLPFELNARPNTTGS